MVNLTFHGIGGQYLVVSKAAHDELLAYLHAKRDAIWTGTSLDIMTHVTKQPSTAGRDRQAKVRSR